MRIPGGPYGQLADDFANYVKTGDDELIERYELKDLRLALSDLVKHKDLPFYRAIEEELKHRQEISAREPTTQAKGMGVFITWSGK